MTDRLANLVAVKTAVEAGVWDHDTVARWLWSQPGRLYGFAHAAFNGSTDAALALLAAVLPGWGWQAWSGPAGGYFAAVDERDPWEAVEHSAPTPARALLLATLAALIEREGQP